MIDVSDVYGELVNAQRMTMSRAFSAEEDAYRRGCRDGVLSAYSILTGEHPEELHEKLSDAMAKEKAEATQLFQYGVKK